MTGVQTCALPILAAFFSTAAVFWFMQDLWQIFVLAPIMGFCQLSLFAGYAMYFPELFPTRLRSTGTSFCYNVGRFVAAAGPLVKIWINSFFDPNLDPILKIRYGGVAMCGVFLVGLVVLPFLPETRREASRCRSRVATFARTWGTGTRVRTGERLPKSPKTSEVCWHGGHRDQSPTFWRRGLRSETVRHRSGSMCRSDLDG